MTTNSANHQDQAPSDERRAIHLLGAMSTHQQRGCRCTRAALRAELDLDAAGLERLLSALHQQGMIDRESLRPTLAGFAIGVAVSEAASGLRSSAASPVAA